MGKEEKRNDDDMNTTIPKNTNKTASNTEIKALYDKFVKTHGKTLERLSKN